jgi:hypothetical protein
MSHRIIVGLFSLLLTCGFTSSAYASTGKPHKHPHHPVKKIKKVKKPHHHHHCR